jgi:hypothetical protein
MTTHLLQNQVVEVRYHSNLVKVVLIKVDYLHLLCQAWPALAMAQDASTEPMH